MTPDITPAALGHPARDDVIAGLRARIATLEESDRRMCAHLMTAGETIAQLTVRVAELEKN